MIEVHESSDFATQGSDGDRLLFWRDEKLNIFNPDDREEGWYEGSSLGFDDYKKELGATIVWQRCTQPEELPFIDDEPSVQATLNERQSSYGCFEDVALVTENIIDALKQVNYNRMPKTHKMAMYMIASKMARIVNGDFNHKDSWHDMQGYAKLIEDLL